MDDVTVERVAAQLLDALDRAAIDYVVVGSLASSFYGVARSTQDADVVISCERGQVADLARELGSEFVRDPQMAFETVTSTTKTLISEKQSKFQIEAFNLSDDPHDQERFARRRKVKMYGCDAYILTVEDVIVTKTRWLHIAGRAKDDSDLRAVIQVQGSKIDWPYVESWCDRHGTRELLDRLRNECAGP
jgi:Nucleotidyltransferase of unknown function (DUF6036)